MFVFTKIWTTPVSLIDTDHTCTSTCTSTCICRHTSKYCTLYMYYYRYNVHVHVQLAVLCLWISSYWGLQLLEEFRRRSAQNLCDLVPLVNVWLNLSRMHMYMYNWSILIMWNTYTKLEDIVLVYTCVTEMAATCTITQWDIYHTGIWISTWWTHSLVGISSKTLVFILTRNIYTIHSLVLNSRVVTRRNHYCQNISYYSTKHSIHYNAQ